MARVFISHSSRDKKETRRLATWLNKEGFENYFLDFDKHSGIQPGSDWERTLYREIERSQAVIIVLTPNWLESKWCFAEFTQARGLGKEIFPIIEISVGDLRVSPDIQHLDLTSNRAAGLSQLSRALTELVLFAQGGFTWDKERPPYPGLLAFEEEDAAVYFGREDEIRRFIERLTVRRVKGVSKTIVLLGASGSGKSSLLRAGIIPKIRRDQRHWIALPPFRPKTSPIREMSVAIAIALGLDDWEHWFQRLLDEDLQTTLDNLARDLQVKYGANDAQILITIDQAEELFENSDSSEVKRIFELLNEAAADQRPYLIVMALRSDYLGELQGNEYRRFRFEEFSLDPLPLERLAQVIEGPARVVGLKIENGLAFRASRDARTRDSLPLLAFALRELYEKHGGDGILTLADYDSLGDAQHGLSPIENAVRRAADEVVEMAKLSDLESLRAAFVSYLVRVNEDGDYARRLARWEKIPEEARPLLGEMHARRLLVIRQEGGNRVVEVAHEALLRKWPRLTEWLDQKREFLIGKTRLQHNLVEWEKADYDEKEFALLTGNLLHRARRWLREYPEALTPTEQGFIQDSVDHYDRMEAARIEERNKRLVTQSRLLIDLADRQTRAGDAATGLLLMGLNHYLR